MSPAVNSSSAPLATATVIAACHGQGSGWLWLDQVSSPYLSGWSLMAAFREPTNTSIMDF